MKIIGERLEYWFHQGKVSEQDLYLFGKLYESFIDHGYFDKFCVDLEDMVDNDVFHCKVINKGDSYYDVILNNYEENGDCEISSISPFSRLEVVNRFLEKILVS